MSASQGRTREGVAMELKGKQVAILVEQVFNDLEFWYPYYRGKEAGAEVVVDGKLITSRKPDDLPAFMKALIATR
ncbi:MAG: hypothetical protein SWQ30_23040 [Thermodesulfobacteriota bacterium]|nr:hypothetical protein [Thermodesulfobacteriota bacterium]